MYERLNAIATRLAAYVVMDELEELNKLRGELPQAHRSKRPAAH